MTLMQRRRALMVAVKKAGGRLPSEYQEVTYIRFLKGTRLDLGNVTISDNPKMAVEFLIVARDSQYGPHLIGSDPNALVFVPRATNTGVIVINTAQNTNIPVFANMTQYKLILDGTTLSIDNVDYTVNIGASTTGHMYIGCYAAQPNSSQYWFNGYIYGHLIIDDKMELVPCYKKADDTIGMYDILTQHFFTNAGSSNFEKGSDVT